MANRTRAKQVLIIAYLFPPIGGGGVQRAVKMARYLGEFGWQVHVLTVEPQYHATLDESLLDEIPDDVIIHRCREDQGMVHKIRQMLLGTAETAIVERKTDAAAEAEGTAAPSWKQRLVKWLKRTKDAVLIPDDQILWYPAARKKGLEIIRQYGIDAIFSTSGPYTNHLVARYLKRKTGLPWIADFRDPWTQNMHRSDIRWREWLEERMERSVHHEANMTLTVTHSFAKNFNEKFGAAITRLEVIHNGYDPADYEALRDVKKEPQDEDRCVFMYAGIFYQERNPRLLLRAVRELIDEGALDRERIVLRFAGVFDYPGYSDNIDAVHELGLTDIVEILGNLPHKQALKKMKQSDILLLVGDTAPESGAYIPGKLYEYLAIGHPILALSMPGESTKLIEKYGLGETADPLSLEEIKRAVKKLYEDWKSGTAQKEQQAQEKSMLKYQRREQARRLAELLNEITGSRR